MYRNLLALIVILGLLIPARAQETSRNSKRIVELFAGIVEKSNKSVVRVRCKDKNKDKEVALGTIVTADGWIVTKASELIGDKISCLLFDGKELAAKLMATDEKYDLAALKVEAKDLVPVSWANSDAAPVGRWIACAGPDRLPVAIGVIGVAARKLPTIPTNPNPGFIGIVFDEEFAGVKVSELIPNGPAARNGVKAGDKILAVNGEKVNDTEEFTAIMQKLQVGDTVELKLERQEKQESLKLKLARRPGRDIGAIQNSMGSMLSARRTGFPTVLQHDAVVKPGDCGGPVIDLNGKVVGLNIARAGRTETFAIPGEVVRELVASLTKGDKTKIDDKTKQ